MVCAAVCRRREGIMEKITLDTRLSEAMKNPMAKDLFDAVTALFSIDVNRFSRSKIARLKVRSIKGLTAGVINKKALQSACDLLNSERNAPVDDRGAVIEKKWWKEAVFYQIYPRSFKDSDGDGVGDIRGIIEKLDYLQDLGIDCIWCCPMYKSPNDDNGYDISDYYAIMEEFGTMEDFDELLSEVHKRGMRLIMDLVVNHTSDEHPWFVRAKQSKDDPYHDYYIWKDDDGTKTPPTDWKSFFGGSAWNYYENLNQWALHVFSKKQMDLNWENPAMRQDIYKMINWWLNKGVDGFRMDVINFISKWQTFPNSVPVIEKILGFCGAEWYFYGPRLHEFLHEMNMQAFKGRDCVSVGECGGLGLETSKLLTADNRGELSMVFNFDHLDNMPHGKYDDYYYDFRIAARQLVKWQLYYGNRCWPTLLFENHDNPRITSKADKYGVFRSEIAKLCATIQLTFRGTPFIYQGQEIAMGNGDFQSAEELRDVEGINMYNELIEKGKSPQEALEKVLCGSRDHARTPMQWDDSKKAGFTTGTPWIKVNKDAFRYNVKDQLQMADSPLNYFKRLIRLRRENPAFIYGDFELIQPERLDPQDVDILCFSRKLDGACFVVEINLVRRTRKRYLDLTGLELISSSYDYPAKSLRPYECNIYKPAVPEMGAKTL